MHKPIFSVIGANDMGSMVRILPVAPPSPLDETWTQSTQSFRKVG